MLFFFYWILYLGTSALIWTTAQARPRSSHGASIELRVYFPVAGALIEHQGSMIEANELGEFEIKDVDSDYVVLGRKQSGRVQGVQGNIIKDGIIYLADQAIQHTKSAMFSCMTLDTRALTTTTITLTPSVAAAPVLKIMEERIAVTRTIFMKGGVRRITKCAWIIMGISRIARRRISTYILPEVIAMFLLAKETAGMKLCRRTVIIIYY
ncbi:hypothetical protein GLOIN_2v1828065 [Rhizophagus irregularis DAOM 181602=DAOM 197198]|nr:hypothetical protein GLOIN_2v1828065 [Rhizophagus irregularis DAOM 181602=DAOM 197198]